MKYYEDMNPRAIDATLDLMGIDKGLVNKLYQALDQAEQRGFVAGVQSMGEEVAGEIERTSLRKWSEGYMDGAARARTSPEVADMVIEGILELYPVSCVEEDNVIGASAVAAGQSDVMPLPEFYQGDSGDEDRRDLNTIPF